MKTNKNRKFVKVSDLPSTWIESDFDIPDATVKNKFLQKLEQQEKRLKGPVIFIKKKHS